MEHLSRLVSARPWQCKRKIRMATSPLATNSETGLNSPGRVLEVAVVDIGGVGALLTISGTRTKTSAGPLSTSTQILAADVTRVAASVQNTDSKLSYLGFGVAAVVGQGSRIAPDNAVAIPAKYVAGPSTRFKRPARAEP